MALKRLSRMQTDPRLIKNGERLVAWHDDLYFTCSLAWCVGYIIDCSLPVKTLQAQQYRSCGYGLHLLS